VTSPVVPYLLDLLPGCEQGHSFLDDLLTTRGLVVHEDWANILFPEDDRSRTPTLLGLILSSIPPSGWLRDLGSPERSLEPSLVEEELGDQARRFRGLLERVADGGSFAVCRERARPPDAGERSGYVPNRRERGHSSPVVDTAERIAGLPFVVRVRDSTRSSKVKPGVVRTGPFRKEAPSVFAWAKPRGTRLNRCIGLRIRTTASTQEELLYCWDELDLLLAPRTLAPRRQQCSVWGPSLRRREIDHLRIVPAASCPEPT
jgi:hypothetical protein